MASNDQLELYNDRFALYNTKLFDKKHSLLFALNETNLRIAKLLLLNNEEISHIQYYYLHLWNKGDRRKHLSVRTIISEIGVKYSPYINLFFNNCNDTIQVHNFLAFVLLFGLFDLESIMYILLVASGIHSNIIITEDQITSFLNLLTANKVINDVINCWLVVAARDSTGHISISSFIQMISTTLDEDIRQIKGVIQEKIITLNYVKKILNRKYYYYYYYNDFNSVKVNYVNRKCLYLNDIFTRIFSNSRSTLSYDYYIDTENSVTDFYKRTMICMRNEYISNIRPYRERSSYLLIHKNQMRFSRNKSLETIQTRNINLSSVKNIYSTNPIDVKSSIYILKSSKLEDDLDV